MSKRVYERVFDRQNRRVRGLWFREGAYFAQLRLDGPAAVRVRLKANNVLDAKSEIETLKQQRRGGILEVQRPSTAARFTDVAAAYLETLKALKRKSPGTIKLEGYGIKMLGKYLGQKHVHEITMADTTSYAVWRKTHPGKCPLKEVSGRIIDLDIVVLRHVMDYAVEQGHIKVNPIGKWKKLAGKPKKVRLLPTAEVEQLIKESADNVKCGKVFSWFLRVLAASGGRYRETLRLRWSLNVDWANRRVGFGQDGLSKHERISRFGKDRWVQFNPNLEEVLKEMAAERKADCDWLFPSYYHPGQPIKSFTGALKSAKDACGINDRLGFHHFRHYFISVCCMNNVDLLTIKEWVGHTDTQLIARIYGHLCDSHRQEQAARIDFAVAKATSATPTPPPVA